MNCLNIDINRARGYSIGLAIDEWILMIRDLMDSMHRHMIGILVSRIQ